MLDLSYFQNSGNVNTQTFTNAGSWVTWVKPRGAKFVNILCIGAGGGGGAGFAGNGGSGGGGACGGYVKAQYQASILPDILYVYTGIGGSGGINAGAASTAGGISYIGLIPDTSSVANLVCVSSITTAGGGAVGISGAGGAGGTAPTAATTANAIFLNLATFLPVVGIAGAAGVAANPGTSITPSQFITPGASGGGTNTAATIRAGGNITAQGPIPQITGGTGTITNPQNGTRGGDGVILYKPTLIFTGGAGGGNSKTTSGTGGAGGNGAYGCGGGSGGGGTPTGGGGNGGNGGDGLVIITTSF
jgi:hypothetical protein